ncbi:hypothetical protein OICFNHDK_2676 [Methylobacterium bullatum]|uniref:Uncharacterized protein n=1 Tax=Methylobacterium bullatum TaxID=570505 RepID=A0AAV4Z9G0_9HYPH|nr:hypothetical protein OICFNHDK_2676 [Methylobacterium bullatum]
MNRLISAFRSETDDDGREELCGPRRQQRRNRGRPSCGPRALRHPRYGGRSGFRRYREGRVGGLRYADFPDLPARRRPPMVQGRDGFRSAGDPDLLFDLPPCRPGAGRGVRDSRHDPRRTDLSEPVGHRRLACALLCRCASADVERRHPRHALRPRHKTEQPDRGAEADPADAGQAGDGPARTAPCPAGPARERPAQQGDPGKRRRLRHHLLGSVRPGDELEHRRGTRHRLERGRDARRARPCLLHARGCRDRRSRAGDGCRTAARAG